MSSPFPGMDPYLEKPALWSDLHLTLIIAIRAELNAHLPKGYLAAADRHVWIEYADREKQRRVKPDVFVTKTRPTTYDVTSHPSATAILPRTVTLPVRDRKGKPYLKILDASDHRVVTVVELLSPANKAAGDDRQVYLAKREDYLAAQVNFVEINLLRAGKAPPLGVRKLLPRLSRQGIAQGTVVDVHGARSAAGGVDSVAQHGRNYLGSPCLPESRL